tara:strand:- start:4707 stop:5063 length:357 start_codon:yes stop_codon:yes gene_type:complete
VAECSAPQKCECGASAGRVYLTAPRGFVGRDVNYDSPIDGRPITSRKAWREDMARNGCSEYDPGMKQDYQRRIKRQEEALDKSVDATVDEMIEKMPARQLEKLESEIRSGADATIDRR